MRRFASALLLLFCFNVPVMAQETVVIQSGKGVVSAKPDEGYISLGVTNHAGRTQAAIAENSRRMNAVLDALANAGVAREDITTVNFSVQPHYKEKVLRNGTRQSTLDGYGVAKIVSVTVYDLARSSARFAGTATIGIDS
jgi:uncharacterized protein YggE